MPATAMIQRWMTRGEAAAYLRVSPHTIDRYAREGRLTKHTLRGLRTSRYDRRELDSLVVRADGP